MTVHIFFPRAFKSTILLAALFFSLAGCTPAVYYDTPIEFRKPERFNSFMDNHSKYFAGKTFFLDAGHGGTDRHNKGPAGKAIEADLNLFVTLHLRDFLETAGAKVILSRSHDTLIALGDRSILANESGADFFISIHHNAPGPNADELINYTSTYYHATETDYIYEPMERDLARYIQRDLAYAMRNSGGLGSFDGTYSDYWIYPGAGFSVLRKTKIPSILVECAFHTNEREEQRLIIPEFNKIQAWGIFRGIARYLSQSIPKIEFVKTSSEGKSFMAEFSYADSVALNPKSVRVFVDSVETTKFSISAVSDKIYITFPTQAERLIKIIAANKKGNHAFPFEQKINFGKEK